jgi:hypothetical protein
MSSAPCHLQVTICNLKRKLFIQGISFFGFKGKKMKKKNTAALDTTYSLRLRSTYSLRLRSNCGKKTN